MRMFTDSKPSDFKNQYYNGTSNNSKSMRRKIINIFWIYEVHFKGPEYALHIRQQYINMG